MRHDFYLFYPSFTQRLRPLLRNKRLLVALLGALLIGAFFVPELHAFSGPIVQKTQDVKNHLVRILNAVLVLCVLGFVATLCYRPKWQYLLSISLAGLMIAGIDLYVAYIQG